MASDKKLGILKNAIQVIVCLFAAFGGFLFNIAPPNGTDVKLPLGIAQFLSLALLLYVSAFSVYSLVLNKKRFNRNYKMWLGVAGFFLVVTIASSFTYFHHYENLVLPVDKWDTTLVRGELTVDALAVCKEEFRIQDPDRCEHDLLAGFYTIDQVATGRLWTRNSIKSSQMKLLVWYIVFVIALSGTLFSTIELLSSKYMGSQSKPKKSSG